MHLPRIDEPTKEEVDSWHATYVRELRALFEEHKAQFGYQDRTLNLF